MNIENIMNNIEAVLFASGQPIKIEKLANSFDMKNAEIVKIVNVLKDRYTNTSLEIIEIDYSYQLVTKVMYGSFIKTVIEKTQNTLLSQAALEVLSIVAYNQPVTRAFVEQTRGVDSSGVLYNLMDRALIEESDRLDLPGRPIAYKTTKNFLRSFSLASLSDLPKIEEETEEEAND